MKLWQKEESIDKIFERFTVGKDPELDVYLAKYDVIGSSACKDARTNRALKIRGGHCYWLRS
tara:strand:+ start:388 stop:573 length:186 start_codon:yes stop_codon:yes gene_type:complete